MEQLNDLLVAVRSNDFMGVKSTLQRGCPVNTEFNSNSCPLNIAIWNNCEEIVHLLLKHGAIPHSNAYVTPLHVALYKGNQTIISLILQHGCDVNLRDRDGFTPLHRACLTRMQLDEMYQSHPSFSPPIEEGPHLSSVELLLKYGSNVNATNKYGEIPLHIACKLPNYELVNLLLQHGSDVNARLRLNAYTPLYVAIKSSHSATIVESLLNHGSRVIDVDNLGKSPLHIAIEAQRTDIIELLLKNGAQVNAQSTSRGQSPLHTVFTRKFTDATLDNIKMLLEHGADPNIADCNKRIALQYVLENDDLSKKCGEIITVFLEYGTDLNAKNGEGESLLHVAACKCPASINSCLIEAGADVNVRDKLGRTPIHLACEFFWAEIVEELIRKGADVNAQTINGDTPFHVLYAHEYLAILHESLFMSDCAKILLQNGGDPNISNNRGLYPFLLLTNVDFINIFLEYGPSIEVQKDFQHGNTNCQFLLKAGIDVNVIGNKKGELPMHIACTNNDLAHVEKSSKKDSVINAQTNNGNLVDTATDKIIGFYSLSERYLVYSASNALQSYIAIYVMKMRIANMNVNEILTNKIREDQVLNRYYEESYDILHEKFTSEMNSLKEQVVSNTLTLYDVLTIDSDVLALHVKHEKVKQIMNSRNYYNSAPNYGPLLEYQFQKAVTRRMLLEACEESLFNLTKLSYPVTRQILHFLPNKDLRQLKNINGKKSDDEPSVT